jgi:plasmid stability protein
MSRDLKRGILSRFFVARAGSAGMVALPGNAALASLRFINPRRPHVAQLRVRKLTDDLVDALKRSAAKNNRSAEQEHREILKDALRGPRRRPLGEVLAAMPNVGEDADFVRGQTDARI